MGNQVCGVLVACVRKLGFARDLFYGAQYKKLWQQQVNQCSLKLEDLKRPDYKNIVKESRCAAEPVFKSSAAREENNGVIHKLLMGNSFLALRSTDMDDFLLLLLQCTTYVHLLEWDEVCHKEYLI